MNRGWTMRFAPNFALWVWLSFAWSGCSDNKAEASKEGPSRGLASASGESSVDDRVAEEARAQQERIDREYPLYGLVSGVQLTVSEQADSESGVLGWLRIGSRVRLGGEPIKMAGCATGWYRIYPKGWVCAGQGIEASQKRPKPDMGSIAPDRGAALPYTYYFVKEPAVPEYHRLPSRDEQRAARAFASRYLELLEQDEQKAQRFMAGELTRELAPVPVVSRYLDRGFFVASTGVEIRAFRNFARTVRGSYVKQARLQERTGSEFRGVELDGERTLPLAFALRSGRPLVRIDREDGTIRWRSLDDAEVIERQSVVEGWLRRENIGGRVMHVLDGERYLRAWFVGVAERVGRPAGVDDHAPWVHIDLSEQTLVLYNGDTPVFATLVSTGMESFETKPGLFTIRKKLTSDTMADLGPDAGDARYRVEDVPWTQYFDGSVAVHGAFWHSGFGLPRSHGCVNLSPHDARRVFEATWPNVPDGWHGVSTDRTGFRGSKVLVTE